MQILEQTVLYDRKWTFRVDKIRLSNGVETDLAMIDHPGAVVIVPMQGDNVLMIDQFRPVLGRNIIELPAGTLDSRSEDRGAAAQRELREETGYRADELIFLSTIFPCVGTTNESMSIYLALGLAHDPLPMDVDEQIELRPMPLADLVTQARNGQLEDGKSVIGILQAQHYLAQREGS